MMNRFPGFTNLPGSVKIVTMILGGGGAAGFLYYFAGEYMRGWGLVVLVLAIGLVLGLWALIRKMRKSRAKKASSDFERGLEDHTKKKPDDVKDPDQIADLGTLRRKFREGITTLKEQGKSPRFLPWYLIIGESGAGKTEAIRHADLNIPPGLTDPQQGTGGTINMDWWFTNDAIILDTAGKLVFEDVEAGGTQAWQEFLKLLKKHRRNCPINGLILAIPATSLIEDSASDLRSKADKLAQQIARIQSSLGGLRFPVYVIVTKSDLITGFREFSREVGDSPDQQDQIFGWSYGGKLDAPFDPEVVLEGMEQFTEEVRERVLSMFGSGSFQSSSSMSREDVGALFSFPGSLSEVMPRLQTYLEKVFKTTTGPWSQQPLFMRGVYFTSAMVEGKVLDAHVADALNVEVEDLPGERTSSRVRPYFLHDVFMEKIISEDGLVTWDPNAKRQYIVRKGAVVGAGIGTLALLAGLTAYGGVTFYRNIGRHRRLWTVAAQKWESDSWPPIVSKQYRGDSPYHYRGNEPVTEGEDVTRQKFYAQMRSLITEHPIHIPWVFWFVAQINQNEFDRNVRAKALNKLTARGVLEPLAEAAEDTLRGGATPDSQLVGELLRLNHNKLRLARDEENSEVVQIEPILDYVVGETEKGTDKYDPELQETLDWLYGTEGPSLCWPEDLVTSEVVRSGLEKLMSDWFEAQEDRFEDLGRVKEIENAAETFETCEDELMEWADDTELPRTSEQYNEFKGECENKLKVLSDAADALEEEMRELTEETDHTNPSEVYSSRLEDIKDGLATLRNELPLKPLNIQDTCSGAEDRKVQKDRLRQVRQRIKTCEKKVEYAESTGEVETLQTRLREILRGRSSKVRETEEDYREERLDQLYDDVLAPFDEPSEMASEIEPEKITDLEEVSSPFGWRLCLYKLADKEIDAGSQDGFVQKLEGLEKEFGDRGEQIEEMADNIGQESGSLPDEAKKALVLINGARYRHALTEAVNEKLDKMPRSPEQIRDRFRSEEGENPLGEITIPFTGQPDKGEKDTYPASLTERELNDWWESINLIGKKVDKEQLLNGDDIRNVVKEIEDACRQYIDDYVNYWLGWENMFKFDETADEEMSAAQQVLEGELEAAEINEDFIRAAERVKNALDTLKDIEYWESTEGDGENGRRKDISSFRDKLKETLDAASEISSEEYQEQLDRWEDLSEKEPLAIRSELLSRKPDDFMEEWVVGEENAQGYLGPYWYEITLGVIEKVCGDVVDKLEVEMEELIESYDRFPITSERNSSEVLSSEEIDEFTDEVDKIVAYGDDTLGGGEKTECQPIDEWMTELCESVPDSLSDILSDARQVARALMQTDKVRVVLPASQSGEAQRTWAGDITISGQNATGRLRSSEDAELGEIGIEDGNVELEFYQYPSSSVPDKSVSVDGRWAVVRLMSDGALGGEASWECERKKNGKVFEVDLDVTKSDGKVPVTIRLELLPDDAPGLPERKKSLSESKE